MVNEQRIVGKQTTRPGQLRDGLDRTTWSIIKEEIPAFNFC